MNKLSNKITWILRLVLGLLFIYAGARKVMEPLEFVDAIAGFQAVPEILIHPIAMGLPVLEIILGLLVIIPSNVVTRLGSYGIVLLNFVFIILLVSAWVRGLSVECGCFGVEIFPPSRWTIQIAIVRDLIFVGMAAWIYVSLNKQYLPHEEGAS